MSLRAIVALAGAGVLGVALVTEHYAVVAGVLALYVLWMFVRDWIDRRQKYAGWTRIK